MTDFLFDLPENPSLAVKGQTARFPIRRIFCVGRNYAAHAAEMGGSVDREAPWYFTKSAWSSVQSGSTIPYPTQTENFHHEIELVVAIGAPAFRIAPEHAGAVVFGYGSGLDMTRRDLQAKSKENRRPWSTSKDIEGGAVLSDLTPAAKVAGLGQQRIHLKVNSEVRQDATLDDQVWNVGEVIADLSRLYHLAPGDLIMTGTPAGVGPVEPGDVLVGGIDGLGEVSLTIGDRE